MELCLVAARTQPVVETREGNSSDIQPSIKQVIGPLQLGAFASPGSPLGLQSLLAFSRFMNNAG